MPTHPKSPKTQSKSPPTGWLESVPTYKEALENVKDKDLHTYGFLGYPVLQTSDIVMYGEPERRLVVPVGEDQASHVELGREIVRKFNSHFGVQVDRQAMTRPENASAMDLLVSQLGTVGGGKGWQVAGSFPPAVAERMEGQVRRLAA